VWNRVFFLHEDGKRILYAWTTCTLPSILIYIWRSVTHYHIHMQAIWEELQDVVHAVDAMVTKTPEEMGK
jgi:hypothetical protein